MLGCVIGYFVGSFFWIYFIPPWSRAEIETEGHVFEDIVAYDIINYRDINQVDVELILKTGNEEYFSYYQDNWQISTPSVFEEGGLYFQPQPRLCDDLKESPPLVFFKMLRIVLK